MSSHIHVEKCSDKGKLPPSLSQEIQAITDQIRERAFSLFERRGGLLGSDLEDWLQAERDIVWSPPSELVEEKDDFRATFALPGLDAKDVEVTATPDALIVEASSSHTHEGKDGHVRFCEFSEQKLFRRLDLPSPVNVDKVTASLDKGILRVVAPKVQAKQIGAAA